MTPREYIVEAIGLIELHAHFQPNVEDWAVRKAEAIQAADQASSIPETYGLVKSLIAALGDRHSFFLTEEQMSAEAGAPLEELPAGERSGRWAYMALPRCDGSADDTDTDAYAAAAHRVLRDLRDADGWIVDLRYNTGGNVWAMIAAIGPLVRDGIQFYGTQRTGPGEAAEYRDGASWCNGDAIVTVSEPAPQIPDSRPMAVLTSGRTMSAGELALVGLIQRPRVRVFGQATFGVPTWNSVFQLSDSALLVLTTGVTRNRRGDVYDSPIAPDVACDNPREQAEAWLSTVRTRS